MSGRTCSANICDEPACEPGGDEGGSGTSVFIGGSRRGGESTHANEKLFDAMSKMLKGQRIAIVTRTGINVFEVVDHRED